MSQRTEGICFQRNREKKPTNKYLPNGADSKLKNISKIYYKGEWRQRSDEWKRGHTTSMAECREKKRILSEDELNENEM